jgi:hypothetical protein
MNYTKVSETKTKVSASLNGLTLAMFNSAIPQSNLSFQEANKQAIKLGYLLHPDVCSSHVLSVLEKNGYNPNSTFYKNWSTVINSTRFELLLDQLAHYASTYGTNFKGEPYIPETAEGVPAFTTLKVISPITKGELISRCEGMLFSGIALKEETIQNVLLILNAFNHVIDIEKVKNKEAMMFLCKERGYLPLDPVEVVRYLVYLATSKTLLIKDKATIASMKASSISLNKIANQVGYEKLSSVFHRFKPLFLALKTNQSNKVAVNKLRRLADKNHKPMKVGFFESVLSNKKLFALLKSKLGEASNFKKILLIETINRRLEGLSTQVYLVRNQKLFVKQEKKAIDRTYLLDVRKIIYDNLVETLSSKACKISLPNGINLTLPTSEKSFIGNFPLGTSFDLSDSDGIVGINWRSEDGADDLDLSLMSDMQKYGWNSAYKTSDNSLVYSGDMTSANPEATEMFYCSGQFPSSLVKVNSYRGSINAKFKFFLAKEKVVINSGYGRRNHYMIDPNSILTTVDCEMTSSEKILGVIKENQFILAQFRTGSGRVSSNSITDLYTDYAIQTLGCYIPLASLLTDAGFEITDENPDIDLNNLSKDTLIDLLTK